ncbi:MAG: RsmB/NOP family class I SAM-dependent RNA methyltransferase [Candidatus Woesearchaeota archaeon]
MEASVNFFLDRYSRLGETVPEKIELKPALRVNTLRIQEDVLVNRLHSLGVSLSKIPWLTHGYRIERSKFSLGATIEFLLGYYYLQEAAAQLPVEILDPMPGDVVLDCCAAPGGKTTQLAQHVQNKGAIIALEKKSHRLLSLRNNLERLGVSNCVVYHLDAVKAEKLGIMFDKVLLDAPCSGNYASDKGWFSKRKINDIMKSAKFQRGLLKAAISVLKPGGVLVYSTCTLEPEENELNMQWLIENYDVNLEPVCVNVGDRGLTDVFGRRLHGSIANCRRFWPHKTGTEGFFIAKVRKT